jgi:hypothetical protein
MRDPRIPLVILFLVGLSAPASAVESEGKVQLNGELSEPADLSGLALHRGLLVVCTDEGVKLNVLRRSSPAAFDALPSIRLLDDETVEIDAEGVASDGRFVFVVGSHSRARKKLEPERTYENNRRRLTQVDDDDGRSNVFRLELGDDGRAVSQDSISLHDILKNDEILAPFTKLPGKENGIDIEGIAAVDGLLYLGFRGPVLRGNYVPVMVLSYEEPDAYRLLFVALGGRGIRDLAAVNDGLLVLAGPLGDGDGPHELYLWNKRDCVPGQDSPGGRVTHVGTLASAPEAKPEGIAVVAETDEDVSLIVVCDGSAQRSVEQIRVMLKR